MAAMLCTKRKGRTLADIYERQIHHYLVVNHSSSFPYNAHFFKNNA